MRYINHLRRRIRDLEQEAAELSQRLNMLLADVDMNIAENNDLRVFQQEIDQQVQVQDALNLSLQEEIMQLRMLVAQDAQQQAPPQRQPELDEEPKPEVEPKAEPELELELELIRNTGRGSQPSTSGSAGMDENISPPEARGA
ncbi:hypothetical protein Pint_21215 [Pistacia integerrima]|uniref:Uncharacterized protein n=1 Tax=Pistacia integerrima TaxID=434235 RepID=A0ACC0XE69_9ROSI|nr:hypothetical protein Pint_21215 [Pistacia integerrima]